jgi:hypothetical protein
MIMIMMTVSVRICVPERVQKGSGAASDGNMFYVTCGKNIK